MSEAAREMTYDEQIANFIIHILAIETPFSVKRDLISHLLSLTYRHERDIAETCKKSGEGAVNANNCITFQGLKLIDELPMVEVVECKDCRHRDPEDHKCDCGQLERAGCVFPVDDDYFCAYGER